MATLRTPLRPYVGAQSVSAYKGASVAPSQGKHASMQLQFSEPSIAFAQGAL